MAEQYKPQPWDAVSAGFDMNYLKKRNSDYTAAFVQKLLPDGTRQILWMEKRQCEFYDIIEFIIDIYLRFRPQIIVPESVAAQAFIIQAFNDPARGIIRKHPELAFMRVEPYHTSQNTRIYDIPGLYTLYCNGKKLLPEGPLTQEYIDGLVSWKQGDHPHDLIIGEVCSEKGLEILQAEGYSARTAGELMREMNLGDIKPKKNNDGPPVQHPGNGDGMGYDMREVVRSVY
jgi:hypothetical protein